MKKNGLRQLVWVSGEQIQTNKIRLNIVYSAVLILFLLSFPDLLTKEGLLLADEQRIRTIEPLKSGRRGILPVSAQTDSGKQIKWQVICSGGSLGGDNSQQKKVAVLQIEGTVGQTATGIGSSPSFTVGNGFWEGAAEDIQRPTFTVGILQNPIFSAELNIFTIPSEKLKASPTITIGQDTLAVAQIVYDGTTIYSSNYKLSTSGTIQIKVEGSDSVNNVGTHIETFATGIILPSGGTVVSHDDVVRLEVEEGAVQKEEYFLIFRHEDNLASTGKLRTFLATAYHSYADISNVEIEGGVSKIYSITPGSCNLKSKARLSISYGELDLKEGNQTKLMIHHWDSGIWRAITSYLDTDRREVSAFINELGVYQLRYGDSQEPVTIPTVYLLKNNHPNPFNSSTQISYELPRVGRIRIVIYDILGRKVKSLVDELKSAGRYSIEWDGKNERGENVSSGVYFYTLKTNDFTQTKKMIYLK